MAFNAATAPEMMTFDEQVVACEVEIDTFDDEYHEEVNEQQNNEDNEDYGEGGQDNPGTNRYDYQYEEEVDPNHVYLFDEDTDQIHQLNQSRNDTEDEIDVVQYVQEEEDPSIPSTSNSRPSTSSLLPTTSSPAAASFTTSVRGASHPPNTYYIRKGSGRSATQPRGERVTMPVYSPISFQTTYSESISRRGKRVIKRTHIPMSTEDMETMIEDTHVMRKIQKEIAMLKKTNEEMKKTYELTHRRFESLNMVLAEAKLKHKDATDNKRHLQRELTLARSTNNQLSKKLYPGGAYRFHRPHN